MQYFRLTLLESRSSRATSVLQPAGSLKETSLLLRLSGWFHASVVTFVPVEKDPPAAGSIGFRREILQRWNHPEADEAFMRPHTCGCSSGRNQMGDSWERGHGASAGMFSFGSLFTYFINSTYILMHSFLLRRRTRITRQRKQWSAGGLFSAVLTVK